MDTAPAKEPATSNGMNLFRFRCTHNFPSTKYFRVQMFLISYSFRETSFNKGQHFDKGGFKPWKFGVK